MKLSEERIICIFEEIDNNHRPLIATEMALVEHSLITDAFRVKAGKYKGATNRDFNIINGFPTFINGNQTRLSIKKYNKKKKSVYVFDNEFIETMEEVLNVKLFDAYVFLFKHSIGVELWPYRIGKLNNIYLAERGINNCYAQMIGSNEYVYSMLYEDGLPACENYEDDLVEEEGLDKPSVIRIYKADLSSGKLKEVTKEDLRDAFPKKQLEEKKEKSKVEKEDVVGIIDDIGKKIIGQDDAIKTMVSNIYYNQLLLDINDVKEMPSLELESRKVNILIDGETGTGKTAIAKAVAEKFNIPIVITNANSFSETGYVGPTITDILINLLNQVDGDIKKAERGIIVLDEIDKLATEKDYTHSMKQGVQEELLTFVSGGKYELKGDFGKKVTFDTSKITFILMGAFTELRDSKIKDNEKNKFGFGEDSDKDKTYILTPQDYIEYGLMREFFGRIKVLTSTKSYTKEDLMNILLNSEISPLKNFEKNARMFGYDGLAYEPEFIERIVNEAYEMKTGARGLQTVMSGIQNNLLMNMITNNGECEKPLELKEENIEDYKKSKIMKY